MNVIGNEFQRFIFVVPLPGLHDAIHFVCQIRIQFTIYHNVSVTHQNKFVNRLRKTPVTNVLMQNLLFQEEILNILKFLPATFRPCGVPECPSTGLSS